MADRNPLVQQLEDRNTAYAVMRAIEVHGGPSVLVCDPATRASVAVIFPIAEWDVIAKIHNETVDDLEAVEEELDLMLDFNVKSLKLAQRLVSQLLLEDSVSPEVELQSLDDEALANILGDVAGVRKAPIDDPVSPGVHNFMDADLNGFYDVRAATKENEAREVGASTCNEVLYGQKELEDILEGPKALERKNLQRRVKEQRKQLDLFTEQAKGRKKEISYWKAVAHANLDTLNHYGIKAPKIKSNPPTSVDEPEFKAVGGYL